MGKPTISQLAKAAGVSPTTVSHAFSGRRYVDPKTRDRIMALARDMGYRPNPSARRLRTGAAGSIAIVSSMPFAVAGGPARLGFLMEIAASAAVAALSGGLALSLIPPLEATEHLEAIELDGAILVEPAADDPVLSYFIGRNVPVVSIGRAPGHDTIPFVDLQSASTARLLLEHLGRSGRRVGLITGLQRRNSYIETEAAYAEFAWARGFQPLAVRLDERGGATAAAATARDLLAAHADIGALCVPVDAFAQGVLSAATDLGLAVPRDLRVATRYDGLRAKLAVPPLTAVDLHLDALAAAAVELLIATLEKRPPKPVFLAAPRLVPRGSSASPADPA